MSELNRALDALQKADAEGNTADAAQIAAYIKDLQAQQATEEQQNQWYLEGREKPGTLRNPVAAGALGLVAGPVVGKIADVALSKRLNAPSAIGAPSPTEFSPGQKWAAKTGFGAGTGETVQAVDAAYKKEQGPLGKGKISSKVLKGSPLGIDPAMETIAKKEAEAARFAAIRQAEAEAAKKAGSVAGRFGEAATKALPLAGRALAGAGAGVELSDAYNRYKSGDYTGAVIGGIGGLGSAAALIPHPVTRYGGAALGAGAGLLNMYRDYNKKQSVAQPMLEPEQPFPGMAQGGLVHLAGGGLSNALTQTAINTPLTIAPSAASMAKNAGKGAYAPAMEDAAALALAMAPLNPLTAALSGMVPSEAGAGSTRVDWEKQKAAEAAARQRAQKQFEQEEFLRTRVGVNAPKFLQQHEAKKMAGGKRVIAEGAIDVAKKAFAPKQTQVLRASEALGPHEGKFLNITQSDRMRSTEGDLGGPGFSKFQREKPEYSEAQAAWGVGNQPTASRIVNVNKKFPEGQAIWTPMIGSETQHHSNQHVFDALTQEFNRQVAAGKLTPELRQRINQKLAMAANKEGKPIFQEGVDIANPEHLQSMGSTFERRGNVANLLAGNTVGGQKGRIIDYPGIMQEMTDPMTVGAPTHALGTRLFTLNNQIENRPDLHSAFPYILKGQDQGVAFAPVPKELGIQDWINQFREFKGREPGFMDLTRNAPSQQITEKYLRSLEAAGHANGGIVDGYAPGGKVLSAIKKLSDEAQAAYKAKHTPGFYHGSPRNDIKAFDTQADRNPNFLTALEEESNDLAPRGFISLTRNPKFSNDYATGKNATVYPVSANLGKHFDPRLPENYGVFHQYLKSNPQSFPNYYGSSASLPKSFREAEWTVMEDPGFLEHLKSKGYNSMTMVENGQPNVGVFNPADIRGKFAKFNPEDAADPDFMKAEGGPVQHFQVGKRVLQSGLDQIAKLARHPHGQDPKVAQALEEYLKGNISQEERIRIANQFLPIRQWNELPPNYTDEQIRNALTSDKQAKALAPVPVGMRVGNRLDIPAYTQKGVYVDTTHDTANKPISYGRTGHLKDVAFSSSPDTFVRVGLGTKEQALTPLGAQMGTAKTPKALIKGIHQGTSDDEVRRMMEEMMKDPRYTQIGMDPRKHSQFYDKSTGMPVFSAEEKLQSGPLILAPKKGLETTSWDDPRLNLTDFPGKRYKKGGKVKKK
jgi:hypothetical protein